MCTQKHCSKSDYFTHSQHVVSSTFTSVFLCCLLLPCCMTNASAANSPPIQSINSDIFSQVVATYWRLGGGPTWWPSIFFVNNIRKHLCSVHNRFHLDVVCCLLYDHVVARLERGKCAAYLRCLDNFLPACDIYIILSSCIHVTASKEASHGWPV